MRRRPSVAEARRRRAEQAPDRAANPPHRPPPSGRASAAERRTAHVIADPQRRLEAGRLGMRLFLASVGVLFAATIAAIAVVRWSPAGEAWAGIGVPWSMLASTLLLAASGAALERSLGLVRKGRRGRAVRWLRAAVRLGWLFLLAQGVAWALLFRSLPFAAAVDDESRSLLLAGWVVVVLTVVHALHVLGGLVGLHWVEAMARSGRLSTAMPGPLLHVRTYWHFLAAVWLAILVALALLA